MAGQTKDRVLYVGIWLLLTVQVVFGLWLTLSNEPALLLLGILNLAWAGWNGGRAVDLFRYCWHGELW